jgi:hemerythrin-like domain-containing protein
MKVGISNSEQEKESQRTYERRTFIEKSIGLSLLAAIGTSGLLEACKNNSEKEISPTEDLMQEHGLLNRILLIYNHCKNQLLQKQDFNPELMHRSAGIIRTFVEDYHEKQEEDYLFPRFEKANQLTELVSVLKIQHRAGRNLTEQIIQITKRGMHASDNELLIRLISDFESMYWPHEAREDTILFPAFRKIVSKHEYDSLGEEFEKNEQRLFGKDGFETMISKVENIEKSLGIYDLALFTPGER